MCVLAAWMAYTVVCHIPSFAKKGSQDWRKRKDSWAYFLRSFGPPGMSEELRGAPDGRKGNDRTSRGRREP